LETENILTPLQKETFVKHLSTIKEERKEKSNSMIEKKNLQTKTNVEVEPVIASSNDIVNVSTKVNITKELHNDTSQVVTDQPKTLIYIFKIIKTHLRRYYQIYFFFFGLSFLFNTLLVFLAKMKERKKKIYRKKL